MAEAGALVLVAQIEVGVDLQHGEVGGLLEKGLDETQGHRVLAAEAEHELAVRLQSARRGPDAANLGLGRVLGRRHRLDRGDPDLPGVAVQLLVP